SGVPIMNCPKCATEVPSDYTYCPQCFTPVEQPGPWKRLFRWLFGGTTTKYQVNQVKFSAVQRIDTVDPATGQPKVVNSLEEVPAELRPQFEEMRQKVLSGEAKGNFVVRDFSGQERTYQSVAEMPPEIRR